MPELFSRSMAVDILHTFVQRWANGCTESLFTDSITSVASHRPQAQGCAAVARQWDSDAEHIHFAQLIPTNVSVRANSERMLVSAYLLGRAARHQDQGTVADFGAMLVLDLTPSSDTLLVNQIRFQINWVEGEVSLLHP